MTAGRSNLSIRSHTPAVSDLRQLETVRAGECSAALPTATLNGTDDRPLPVANGSGATSTMLAVWTRELDSTDRVGRVNVARKVREALQDIAQVSNRRLNNAFEGPRPLWSLLAAVTALATGLLSGRPLPLQCALFAASSRRAALLADGLGADVVYLDGIRTLLFLRRLRQAAPQLRIVVDLDDLMSRRYEYLGRRGIPLPLGYLERMVPRSLSRLALGKNVARLVFWYESRALRHAEAEVLRLADSAVLLNSTEAAALQAAAGTATPGEQRAAVVAIRPMAKPIASAMPPTALNVATDWHAIFVGSDMLVQNRLTIDYLLGLWATCQIETKLLVFGRQEGRWPTVANVTFCGYIADIADAYKPGSILIYPCFVPGGIKTKVLEAFAYRVPVVGNGSTFEDILPADYPLVIEDEATLVSLLKDPASYAEELTRATCVASAYLAKEHSASSFGARWRQVVLGNGDTHQ